jgi:hypothetical protein
MDADPCSVTTTTWDASVVSPLDCLAPDAVACTVGGSGRAASSYDVTGTLGYDASIAGVPTSTRVSMVMIG